MKHQLCGQMDADLTSLALEPCACPEFLSHMKDDDDEMNNTCLLCCC